MDIINVILISIILIKLQLQFLLFNCISVFYISNGHYATNRQVAGSFPDGIIGILQ